MRRSPENFTIPDSILYPGDLEPPTTTQDTSVRTELAELLQLPRIRTRYLVKDLFTGSSPNQPI